MTIINNTPQSNHKDLFYSLCQKADELFIVSPFCFPDFKAFSDRVAAIGKIGKVTFITTLQKDGVVGKIDSLLSFRYSMERIGVEWELRLDEHLHGKVYIFRKGGQPFAGIITSANLTESGMELNHEYGCVVECQTELVSLEKQLLTDASVLLTSAMLDDIKERAKKQFPDGVKKEPVAKVGIDDILHPYNFEKGTRIFVKPIGSSEEPAKMDDYSKDNMYFSRRPAAVRPGDIMIAYGVGTSKIIGAFKITSKSPLPNDHPLWRWCMEAVCLTPNLSNMVWYSIGLFVMSEATKYAATFGKHVTMNGNDNLNGLKMHNDKIQLTEEYGQYLLDKLMAQERQIV